MEPLPGTLNPLCAEVMCEMFCEHGFEQDDNGCDMCTCKANPLCAEVMCMMFCEHGFEQDENGCDTCICKANPLCSEVMCEIFCEHGFEQDDNGCDMCVCKANPLCPEVMCMMFCEHGYEKDDNGCDTCVCKVNPLCSQFICDIFCEHGYEQDDNRCDLCECKEIKNGQCPDQEMHITNGTLGACADMCTSDNTCPSFKKCCFSGCGHVCVEPKSVEKIGICPVVNNGSFGLCVEACNGDATCGGSEKCCSNGCGRTCMEPTNPLCPEVMCMMYCEHGFEQDENGCDMCVCKANPLCPEVMCMMYCEHGFEQDENGCDMCVCKANPLCPEVMCMMYCEHGFEQDENGCDMCVCKVEKIGICPVVNNGSFGLCVETCNGDATCGGSEKCCSNGCGRTCMEPANPLCPEVMCMMYCEHGFEQDENGCDMCVCKANPLCAEVMCMMYCEHGFEQDENGCDTCVCKANPLCPEFMCMMYCEHGFEQDENGCDMCVCKANPLCLAIRCMIFCEHGYELDDNGCDTCICKVPKDGLCPVSRQDDDIIGICSDMCESDYSCTGSMKCCSNGCGHVCMEPLTEEVHSGECPTTSPDLVGICTESCTNDGDCSTNEKCCSNGCGHTCMAVKEEETASPPTKCSQLMCRMFCPLGFKKDENGCTMCECLELNAGSCPIVLISDAILGTCSDECSTDSDCGLFKKCCSNGCGHSCQYPIDLPTNPGKCPAVHISERKFCIDYVDICVNDGDCGSVDKCCYGPCGRMCRAPSNEISDELLANDNGSGVIAASFVTICLIVLSSFIAV
ncbi:cysteine-rich motor neuron 1 protein-like isoform X7 [Anneissia japonica]|uniref:cysteine-rich motor neuron 1 protein-like isoform X7 n=1 Tax=Anneissia japonica TaxID=1529436 RepID=UPI00142561D9|nr:cysteine-rich motor neuron 1 protein-like isoform X7 [Anneissia japonica]